MKKRKNEKHSGALMLEDPNSDSSDDSLDDEYPVETEESGSQSRHFTEECEDEEVDLVDH